MAKWRDEQGRLHDIDDWSARNRAHGFTGREVGEAYAEMAGRGLLPGGGLTAEDRREMQHIGGEDEREFNQRQRKLSERIGQRAGLRAGQKIEGMTETLKAMRELYGEAGKQGSIGELFEAMEQITQGGMASKSPAQMRHTIRQFQTAIRMGPGTVRENMRALQQAIEGAGDVAEGLGLSREQGAQAATQSTMFGKAWRDLAGQQGFGGLTAKQAQGLDTQLRLGAAGSEMANSMGAIRAMQQAGLLGNVAKGSKLEAIMAAMAETNAAKRRQMLKDSGIADMSQSELMKQLEASGVDPGTAGSFLSQRRSNEEQILRGGYAGDVRGVGQEAEVDKYMEQQLGASTAGGLAKAGVSRDLRRQNQGALNQAIVAKLREIANDPKRKKLITDPDLMPQLAKAVMAGPVGELLDKMGVPMARRAGLIITAIRALGESFRGTAYKNLMGGLVASGKEVGEATDENLEEGGGTGEPGGRGKKKKRGGGVSFGEGAGEGEDEDSDTEGEDDDKPKGGDEDTPAPDGGDKKPDPGGRVPGGEEPPPAGGGGGGGGGEGWKGIVEAISKAMKNISGHLTIHTDGTGDLSPGGGSVPR